MEKVNYVEVFCDRPYYIVSVENNEVKFKEIRTKTLSGVIESLKQIKNMKPLDRLIACCYRQYEGSFNIEVDPQKQYEKIYEYGMDNYATFAKKINE